MNRISQLFKRKPENICSIFITAGFPHLNSTVQTVLDLEKEGADLVEIGIPFSDPLADGQTIQHSSSIALANGMNLKILFEQVVAIRRQSKVPIVLMGYLNPIMSYGMDDFLIQCENVGVDGLIIPDISMEEYELNYKKVFDKYEVPLTFLVTPKTSLERVLKINELTKTFVYYVSSSSTTGKNAGFSKDQERSFKTFAELKLNKPALLGFGIHDAQTFELACNYFNGAIIGSAFLRSLEKGQEIKDFMGILK